MGNGHRRRQRSLVVRPGAAEAIVIFGAAQSSHGAIRVSKSSEPSTEAAAGHVDWRVLSSTLSRSRTELGRNIKDNTGHLEGFSSGDVHGGGKGADSCPGSSSFRDEGSKNGSGGTPSP